MIRTLHISEAKKQGNPVGKNLWLNQETNILKKQGTTYKRHQDIQARAVFQGSKDREHEPSLQTFENQDCGT